ncbi:FecR family protein [Algoriphagus chordae]|uniref:FecR family protein n=1 Tax=Algoriphagus chordae TaxID=237019 RepID=A0A2W7QSU1_9BACT|nr:FecR domain-containing protein [Algoriphagus chordae]PZX49140.1 FecR family protein [Algoriphagus chordae]
MNEEGSNIFRKDAKKACAWAEETSESDYVDQLDIEEQKALKKKLLAEIKSGIRKQAKQAEKRKMIFRYSKIAASALLILAMNIGLWSSLKLEIQTYQTGANETLQIALPDGSSALLNSNSSLSFSYTKAFGFDRKVQLIGEAYFDIAKDTESKRFVINEGDVMEVEVFGTEFNFKNQPPIHKLTLIEGSVKLGYQGKEGDANLMVSPGETIKLNLENHQIESKTTNKPTRLLAWKERKLRMQNESLDEVLSIVTEMYDLELIEQKIPLTNQLISGSLPLTDNPTEVIENIAALYDTPIAFEQNTIRVQ